MALFEKLIGFKNFARRVIRLFAPYFQSEEKWKARGMFLAIVALNLGSVYMAVLFNDEAERVYQALGLSAFQQHETEHASQPLLAGHVASGVSNPPS